MEATTGRKEDIFKVEKEVYDFLAAQKHLTRRVKRFLQKQAAKIAAIDGKGLT